MADAAHSLTDVGGLLIAWGAAVLAKRAGTQAHTWGLGRATIMAAMLNTLAILVGVGVVIWEASRRFQIAVGVPGGTILLVALIGIGVNAGSALLFMRARKGDLNARGVHLSLDGVPEGFDRKSVADWLRSQSGVLGLHDLHIWPLSTTRNALSVHLVWQGENADALLRHVAAELKADFGIDHATIQIEHAQCARAESCAPIR